MQAAAFLSQKHWRWKHSPSESPAALACVSPGQLPPASADRASGQIVASPRVRSSDGRANHVEEEVGDCNVFPAMKKLMDFHSHLSKLALPSCQNLLFHLHPLIHSRDTTAHCSARPRFMSTFPPGWRDASAVRSKCLLARRRLLQSPSRRTDELSLYKRTTNQEEEEGKGGVICEEEETSEEIDGYSISA